MIPEYTGKLDTLEIAMDEERMSDVLTPIIRKHFGPRLQIQGVRISVIQSRCNRCVLRYHLDTMDPDRKSETTIRMIGKVLKADVGAPVFENMQQLWNNGFARGKEDGISMPEPLEFLPSLNLLLQEEIPGLPLRVLLKQSAQQEHFRQLARTLVKLHKCPIAHDTPLKVRDFLLRCHPKHEFLPLACPELAPSINHIVERAYELEATFSDMAYTPLHGDFHLGQVHLENRHTWLIDFDALGYGDPASDLANVLVFLKGKVRHHPEINGVIHSFLDEYFSLMEPGIGARIPFYEALTHVRRACKCLRLQKNGWQQRVTNMVGEGVTAIEQMG